MTTKTKTLLANIFFHFGILGLVVRPLYYPNMPDEYWLILVMMIFVMHPIIAYFFGWDMRFKGLAAAADAPNIQRFSHLAMFVFGYIIGLLIWLGVIVPVPREHTGMVLGYLYSVVV